MVDASAVLEVMHVLHRLERRGRLRRSLSAYDATFVALAEGIEATIVTTDRRLGGANGLRAPVEVY